MRREPDGLLRLAGIVDDQLTLIRRPLRSDPLFGPLTKVSDDGWSTSLVVLRRPDRIIRCREGGDSAWTENDLP